MIAYPLCGRGIIMCDATVEPFAVEEELIDGFTERQIEDGLVTFASYRLRTIEGQKVKVIKRRFVMRQSDFEREHQITRELLYESKPLAIVEKLVS